uniref:Uncharacterized protein n=1 Tax=Arundo donax TaxID=35708 RepID=A0A0A9H8Q3_ARUDO
MDLEDQGGARLEVALRDGAHHLVDLVLGDLALGAFLDRASTFSAAAACCRTAVRRSSATPASVDRRLRSDNLMSSFHL